MNFKLIRLDIMRVKFKYKIIIILWCESEKEGQIEIIFSNICTEIMEYTSKNEIAVYNLASVSLSMFVRNGAFDFNGNYMIQWNEIIK